MGQKRSNIMFRHVVRSQVMSWRRAQHLVCRGGGYQVRFPIPADIQSKLHRKEFRRSVRARNLKTAMDRAVQATLANLPAMDHEKVRLLK